MREQDSLIQRQVENALKNTRLLRTDDIRIETRNGEVTLYGFVDVLAEKWAAGEVVKQVPGVVSVDNSLTVAIDRPLEDSEINELVMQKLYNDPRVDLHQIKVTVREGIVYLEGNAATIAEEEAAKELAARTPGVKDVISYIYLGQGDFDIDDATLTNMVETALARNTAVSARDIETRTDDGTVILEGGVDTPGQIKAARRVAAQVQGVKKIDNRLAARHGSRETDYNLTNAIREELGRNGLGGVRCFVVDGTVFLDGAVGTPDQKHKAEEVVRTFEGINGVHNDIQIS